LNPSWTEDSTSELENRKFKNAVVLTGSEFIESVEHLVKEWLPARNIVESSLSKRFEHDASGQIMVLDQFCPFQGHLFDIEEENPEIAGKIKYVIFADTQRGYRVRCVADKRDSFNSRLPLPAAWRALRDAELSKVAGIDSCVFVHAAGFIGGNDTLAGAVEMAKKSLLLVV
jgi:uncharacterized UPF0160 family protein